MNQNFRHNMNFTVNFGNKFRESIEPRSLMLLLPDKKQNIGMQ